jgi:N-acetylneuraminate synthase/N,N'-diacetyllegionaminate synthase
MSEVEAAVDVLSDGGARHITILHCVSAYPTVVSDFDLGGMLALQRRFPEYTIGISDHSAGSTVPLAAVALGGRFVEKHLTPDRRLPGPDHSYALEPDEFAAVVRQVRQLETSLATPVRKVPKQVEATERFWARRGLYASHRLAEGSTLAAADLVALRPCAGVGAEYEDIVLGRRLSRSLGDGEELRWTDL